VDSEGINATYTTAYLPGIHKVIENGTRPWELFGGQQVIVDVARILVDTMPSIPYKDSRTPEAESIINEVLGETFINNIHILRNKQLMRCVPGLALWKNEQVYEVIAKTP
jgi:hypothetical protein